MGFNFIKPIEAKDWELTKNKNIFENKTISHETYDEIDKPKHYIEGRKYEPDLVINDWNVSYNIGNCIKYLSRLGRKDERKKDICKALHCLLLEMSIKKDISKEDIIKAVNLIYSKNI